VLRDNEEYGVGNKIPLWLLGSLQVAIAKTHVLPGLKPPVSVDEGLRRTAQFFLHEMTR
jgi:hypothetical protein